VSGYYASPLIVGLRVLNGHNEVERTTRVRSIRYFGMEKPFRVWCEHTRYRGDMYRARGKNKHRAESSPASGIIYTDLPVLPKLVEY
jgi:hypothetical protein